MVRSSLSLPQVRMILRIYWTDRYTRRAQGLKNATHGMQKRLAQQFRTSPDVIKKVVSIKHNQHGQPRRERYPTVNLRGIQVGVQTRLKKLYGDLQCLRSTESS